MSKIEFTKEQLEEIKHLYWDELWSIDDIATVFKCSASTIRLRLKEMNVSLGKDRFLINKKFGYLTVQRKAIELMGNSIKPIWECKCDCGNICYKETTQLTRKNRIVSCGCFNKKQITELGRANGLNLVGKRFGKLVVLEKTDKRIDHKIVWKCQCDCGNIAYVQTNNLQTGHTRSCGCLKSQGELIIRQILEEEKINFIQEYRFNDCRYKNPLPFDFYLPEYNCCIEFDGAQHYPSSNRFSEDVARNDKIKTQYCKDNNIKLIRIPYWYKNQLSIDFLKKKGVFDCGDN